jgi:lyso-ornithine lipid O-acyltransferase
MIGRIRIFLILIFVVISTTLVYITQTIALKTHLWSEAIIPKLWHRYVGRALGFRVQVKGTLSSQRPLLIVSNHISWTDILVLGSFADVNFIARGDMEKWPVMGTLAKLQRTIFVDREKKRTSGDQAGEIAQRLASGTAVVLFAEGTTGDGNGLLPFKSTLFGAASMAVAQGAVEQVFIQPVAIVYARRYGIPLSRKERTATAWIGDEDLGPHIKSLLNLGAFDVEVHVGEPIAFTAASKRKEVARQVESEIRTMMLSGLRGTAPAVAA